MRKQHVFSGLTAVSLFLSASLNAGTYVVTEESGSSSTTGTLSWAITQANANSGSTIEINVAEITDTSVPDISASVTILNNSYGPLSISPALILGDSVGLNLTTYNSIRPFELTTIAGPSTSGVEVPGGAASFDNASAFYGTFYSGSTTSTSITLGGAWGSESTPSSTMNVSFGMTVEPDAVVYSSGMTYYALDGYQLVIDGSLNASVSNEIYGGVIVVNGSQAGDITNSGIIYVYGSTGPINNQGTVNLCGGTTGTITGNAAVTSGCSISNSTIDGDYLADSGASLSVSMEPGAISHLRVTGDVVLGEDVTLEFRPDTGCYARPVVRHFLEADGAFTGQFASVDVGSLLLRPEVTYTGQGVTLTVHRNPLTNVVTESNAQAVASVADILVEEQLLEENTELCERVGELILASQEEITDFVDQLQPSMLKGLVISQENNAVRVQETISYRMQDRLNQEHCSLRQTEQNKEAVCQKDDKMIHIWADGFGDILHQKNVHFAGSSHVGYQTKTGGVVLGVEDFFAEYFYAGALGAYTGSTTHFTEDAGKGTISTGYGGLYFSALGEMFYANASVIGGWSHYTGQRNILSPETSTTASSSYGGNQLLSHIDTGINMGWGGFTLRPFDAFDYIAQSSDGFTEHGAGTLDLQVQGSNAIMLRNELGLQFGGCFCKGGTRWTISPKISWVREVRIKGSHYTANFVDDDMSFTVTGYFPNRSLVSPGLLMSGMLWKDLLTIDLYYNGEFGEKFNDQNFGGQLRFAF